MPLALDSTNEAFAIRIAELIETKGHTVAKYEDPDTGSCCVLGGLRIAIFGDINIHRTLPGEQAKRERYWELSDWLSEQVVRELPTPPQEDWSPDLIVGGWNDTHSTEYVLRRLREIGGANVLAVPQA